MVIKGGPIRAKRTLGNSLGSSRPRVLVRTTLVHHNHLRVVFNDNLYPSCKRLSCVHLSPVVSLSVRGSSACLSLFVFQQSRKSSHIARKVWKSSGAEASQVQCQGYEFDSDLILCAKGFVIEKSRKATRLCDEPLQLETVSTTLVTTR